MAVWGVLGALEIIATLNDAGRQTGVRRLRFHRCEGSRFGTDILKCRSDGDGFPGRGLRTGRSNGLSVKGEPQKIGFWVKQTKDLCGPLCLSGMSHRAGPVPQRENVTSVW